MFNEFQVENLIGDIQAIDGLNFLDYNVYDRQFSFTISTEDDVYDYIEIVNSIMLKYNLIVLGVYYEDDETLIFEAVTFNRFGAN